ncbi:hypothetical protein FRB95_012945 [Tulasnella sp. JGI-2019a]|nr:hypothetical protein FRB95_012945 [Tulasnella sp. JGI-2019a]
MEILDMEEGIDMFCGGVDRLRHIDLSDFPIRWNSPLLSRLQTFKVTGSSGVWPPPSTSEILGILRQCPELRTFKLGYHGMGDPASGTTKSELNSVHLPFLEDFTLMHNDAHAITGIITSIYIPKCRKFHLTSYSPRNSIFSSGTSHFVAALLSAIQSLPEISITVTSTSLTLACQGNANVYIRHHSPWEDFTLLIEAAILWPPIKADITVDPQLSAQAIDCLSKMTSITRLKLIGHSDQYIALLSNPTLNSFGEYKWVLPNLRELLLRRCAQNSIQLLMDLQDKRQIGVDGDLVDGVRLGLPIKLEKIHVQMTYVSGNPVKGEFYASLRELKGNRWDGYMLSQ